MVTEYAPGRDIEGLKMEIICDIITKNKIYLKIKRDNINYDVEKLTANIKELEKSTAEDKELIPVYQRTIDKLKEIKICIEVIEKLL
jgi:hypothetical protein